MEPMMGDLILTEQQRAVLDLEEAASALVVTAKDGQSIIRLGNALRRARRAVGLPALPLVETHRPMRAVDRRPFDLVQESGRPNDTEIERRFVSPQSDGGDDAG